eukprot:2480889-Pleurochrysis_carterae.AAC.1
MPCTAVLGAQRRAEVPLIHDSRKHWPGKLPMSREGEPVRHYCCDTFIGDGGYASGRQCYTASI